MPLAEIWTEASFINEHTNALIKSHVLLLHAAMADVLGSSNALKNALEMFDDG